MSTSNESNAAMTWTKVCENGQLADGEMMRLEGDPPIAIYRVGTEYFATAATCTHMDSCLTEGYLEGDTVECALHMARFCVRTGKALTLPATVALKTFPVRVVMNAVEVARGES